MVRGRGRSGGVDAGGSLSPAEASRDAADRLLGQRALLALRAVAIVAVIVFAVCGILVDPDIVGIESRYLGATTAAVWVLPSVAALVVMIVCRRPACRQVFWLREVINVTAGTGVLAGGIGVIAGFYGAPPALVVLCWISVLSGVATFVLHYTFRTRRVR
ncbi:MAG: hypothetical protein ACRDSR_23190 [Pseudonocardiaceae bacterium]